LFFSPFFLMWQSVSWRSGLTMFAIEKKERKRQKETKRAGFACNPIQSNPIQSNPIQSIQSNPMKAIITKYIPASNYRQSRVKATAEGVKPITLPWDYSLSTEDNHLWVALELCASQSWKNDLISGALPDQSGYAFCFSR
jgi:hypothetical protein